MGSCCGVDKEALANVAETGSASGRIIVFLEKVKDFLENWPMLAISGVSLVASFLLTGHGCHSHGAPGGVRLLDPAWIPLFICGLPILKEALEALIIEKRIRASLLISCAMVSCVSIGQLFAAGEVAFIMALGEMLEGWTIRRAKTGLAKLVSLAPATARYVVTCPKCLAKGEKFRDVPVEKIEPGDGVRVLPGETIPVDGVITEGATSIDQSTMTGESLPVDKREGDEVYSGTINRFGAITLSATKAGNDSSLQKLIRLVKEAEKKKAPMQRIADKWAAILVPCSLSIAVLTFLGVWTVMGDFHTALIRGVTIMVVFCPCALALATPTSIMAAIGQATKFGVIIKSGEALERMGKVKAICFDKTGTLTTGRLSVARVLAFGSASEEDVLFAAASVEASSEHPLAKAIVAEAEKRSLATRIAAAKADDFVMTPGKGVKAKLEGKSILCGNLKWLEEHGIRLHKEDEEALDTLRREGKAVVAVAIEGEAAGVIALSDSPREEAAGMIAELPEAGLRPILLTGDHASTATFVASQLGIKEVRADLLPAGKAAAIEEIQAAGEDVAMIGDGVNDAVALKTAAVGIAMGGMGSDIAVEAADIALVGDDLMKIPYLHRLSVACVKLIKFNITLSMCINACAITLSILGVLTPVTGALVHNLGSVCVVLNGALLYDRNYRKKPRA